MKLIDVDALRERFKIAERCEDCPRNGFHCQYDMEYSARDICGILDDAEIIDAVPRQLGWWVEEPDRENHWHCSQCETVQGITCVSMKYCPNCGAEMTEHPWAASGCGQTHSPD